jgi:hypothetical protein
MMAFDLLFWFPCGEHRRGFRFFVPKSDDAIARPLVIPFGRAALPFPVRF